jgi:hypothetical protein
VPPVCLKLPRPLPVSSKWAESLKGGGGGEASAMLHCFTRLSGSKSSVAVADLWNQTYDIPDVR